MDDEEFPENQEKKKSYFKKISENYWIASTIVLAILLIIILFSGGITGNAINTSQAGQKLMNFANAQGANAELVNVKDDGSLYLVTLLIDGQNVPVHITKDGKYIGQMNLIEPIQTTNTQTQTPQQTSYSEEDLNKLKEFNQCLAKKGVKIYGANWCGWTKKLVVDTLGGFDTASPVYVECTENEELCASEGVQGYPTIKIKGEVYTGDRTIEAIAKETECIAPELTGIVSDSIDSDATCG